MTPETEPETGPETGPGPGPKPAPPVAGVDGCRAGWLVVVARPAVPLPPRADPESVPDPVPVDRWEWAVLPDLESILERWPDLLRVGVDMPVGLPETGTRACDRLARRLLAKPPGAPLRGDRSKSVFNAPPRAVLDAPDYDRARRICLERQAPRLSLQAWNILPKIRRLDLEIRARPERARVVVEVHPELAFLQWNAGQPMLRAKKGRHSENGRGLRDRLELVLRDWPDAETVVDEILRRTPRREVARDDVPDAFAALRAALRVQARRARTLPEPPETDPLGLPMAIRY